MKLYKQLLIGAIAALTLGNLFPASVASAGGSDCWRYRTAEVDFARKINKARSVVGKGSLHLDKHLSKVARKQSRAMARNNRLYHTPSHKLRWRVTNWNILGENVGVGGSVDSLHVAFMASPAHKANILYSSFRHVGVGTKRKNGRLWVTVVFEAATNPGTRLNMPSC